MVYRLATVAAALSLLMAGALTAQAGVLVTVNKSTQTLSVSVNGQPRYQWPVSTARWGYRTPNGTYRPERLERQWYSRKYDNSPMPYSIFFDGGYAIHGSYEISHIGRPASHGCIRLYPRNAAVLFKLVMANRDDTRIVVTGARQERAARAAPHRYSNRTEQASARYRVRERRYYDGSFDDVFNQAPGYYGDAPFYDPPPPSYRRRYRPW